MEQAGELAVHPAAELARAQEMERNGESELAPGLAVE
jgi:hypothetical protein